MTFDWHVALLEWVLSDEIRVDGISLSQNGILFTNFLRTLGDQHKLDASISLHAFECEELTHDLVDAFQVWILYHRILLVFGTFWYNR